MTTPPEPKKSIWKRSWQSRSVFVVAVTLATFVIVLVVGKISGFSKNDAKFLATCGASAIGLGIGVVLIAACFRWLRRPGSLRKVLFALACIITLIALFYAEEDARGKWAWNRFKRQWEARGEKFDLSSFAPPPVPDDQNFALTPIMFSIYGSMIDKTGHEINPRNTNLINRLNLNIYSEHDYSGGTNGSWIKGTLTDLRGWQNYYRNPTNQNGRVSTNEFPTSPQPQSPAEDVLLALSKYDSTLEELRQASRMPYSRFPLEYDKDDPSMILLPHLAKLKQSGLFLELRAIAELQAGRSEQSAADIKLMCYLIESYRTEPFLISHLVRLGAASSLLQPIYEGLAGHNWSDAQLAALDAELMKIDFLSDYERSMRGEAVGSTKLLDHIEHTRKISPFLNIFNENTHGFTGIDLVCYLLPAGWFHQNQIRISEFFLRQCAPVVDLDKREVSPTAAKRAQKNLDETVAHPTPYSALETLLFSEMRNWVFDKNSGADRFARRQASVDLARVGIALERYRLAHGAYPEALDVLAPQFIQKLPQDVIGGQPLKYKRTNDSFVLYSIGWNEKDDGGVAALKHSGMSEDTPLQSDPEEGDWVWVYPKR